MAGLYCQKCRTSIKVDGSLDDLNPASFKILADAAPVLEPSAPSEQRSAAAKERRQQYDEVVPHAGPPMQKRNAMPTTKNARQQTDMSYIMLTESQMEYSSHHLTQRLKPSNSVARHDAQASVSDGVRSFSQQMETTMRLFEILSARSDIDHPVCSECTELLMEGLQQRQTTVTRERDAYVDFLKKVQQDVPSDEERAKTSRQLDEAQYKERKAMEELRVLEAEKAKLEAEIAILDAESDDLDDEEEAFWRARNTFTTDLNILQEERDSLQTQLAHETKLLESLQRTNVYNDTFCIGHDGLFATINGLRLGRLPDNPVEWTEINAAWGQALLLLSVISEKLGFTFQGFKLLPMGSTSKIEKHDYPGSASDESARNVKPKITTFDLYGSGDLSIGLNFFNRSVDSAMVAFLECLRQLGNHVQATSATKMPYSIQKDKIEGVSIKLGNFAQEEQWTKACKYTLTCCKFLLAHASHVDYQRQDVSNPG
ncbi:APG6-domain-containing protein [Polychaeton citri CBS 116435]|uniref:APG6-domain-containing protein n=1 Tax=Polychaeton citri CBS 116435 TaxID=1314669 RepID=A0A9P4Q7S1_9PEZI|nr:APG6-domain-containing protein [Polychaeton citri CBS 116435]